MYHTSWAYPDPPPGQCPVIAAQLLQNMLGTTVQELHETLHYAKAALFQLRKKTKHCVHAPRGCY